MNKENESTNVDCNIREFLGMIALVILYRCNATRSVVRTYYLYYHTTKHDVSLSRFLRVISTCTITIYDFNGIETMDTRRCVG